MAFEVITLNLTPTGDRPVIHLAQYDNTRPFGIELMLGEDEFSIDTDAVGVELRVRKTDSHLVTIEPTNIDDNFIEFQATTQMCACPGKNIGNLVIYALSDPDQILHSLNIDIEVQRDVMQGGLNSVSDINNLETQITDICEDVFDDELPGKLNELVPPIVDSELGNYYTKSQVDTALSAKADSADLATVATTGDYDDLLNKPTIPAAQVNSDWDAVSGVAQILNKPTLSTVATSGDYDDLLDKPYIPNTYSTTEEQIIGTWIDGRPIYRKVVVYDNTIASASGWLTLLSVTNIEAVINGWVIVDENVGGRRYGKRDMYLIEAAPTYNNIQIYNASPYGVYVKWVVVEYIKSV